MNTESRDTSSHSDKEKLFDLINDFETTVLITRTAVGELRGRPMWIGEINKTEGIWFATHADNAMIDDINRDPQVCLSMQSKSHFVSLSGQATVHNDRPKIEQLWQPAWEAWFPNGKEDPKIRLLRVLPSAGDYWDMSSKSRWQVLWEMGEAYCTHRQSIHSELTHGHVDLST